MGRVETVMEQFEKVEKGLIDAQAVRRAVCNVDIPEGVTEEQFAAVLGNVCEALQMLPTIDAVPIKAISAWLAAYAAPPKYALDKFPESGHCLANTRAAAWEHHIRTMIECGLLQEDENGDDL